MGAHGNKLQSFFKPLNCFSFCPLNFLFLTHPNPHEEKDAINSLPVSLRSTSCWIQPDKPTFMRSKGKICWVKAQGLLVDGHLLNIFWTVLFFVFWSRTHICTQVRLSWCNKSKFSQRHWVCLEMLRWGNAIAIASKGKSTRKCLLPTGERPGRFCYCAEFPLLVLFAGCVKKLFSDACHLQQRWRGTALVGQQCIVLGPFHSTWSSSEGSLPASKHNTELPRSGILGTITKLPIAACASPKEGLWLSQPGHSLQPLS